MKKFLLASGIAFLSFHSTLPAQAQTRVIVKQKSARKVPTKKLIANPPANTYPAQTYTAPTNSTLPPAASSTPNASVSTPPGVLPGTPSATLAAGNVAASVSAPAPTPIPWKIAYHGEFSGPRLENFDIAKTQGPMAAQSDYGTIDHSLKLGYAVSDVIVLGARFRGSNILDPASIDKWQWANFRIYDSWKNFVDTDLLNIQQVLEVEFPTTKAAKDSGLALRLNINSNWVFKTSVRNMSFSFYMVLSPRFYNNPTADTKDFYFGWYPTVSVDLATDLSLIFEGSFDSGHSYQESFFYYNEDDPDYVNVGLGWQINSHVGINPALRFYTFDPSPQTATVFLALDASL